MKRIVVGMMAVALAVWAQKNDQAERLLKSAMNAEMVDGDLKAAIEQYKTIAAKYGNDRAVAAQALIHMAECYQKLGDTESRKIYERVLREYADQKDAVAVARGRLGGTAVARETGLAQRQVWNLPASAQPGRPSPDGRYLAWVNWESEAGGLALHDMENGENRELTHHPWIAGKSGGFAESPLFTPDGKQILYAWYQDDTAATGENEWQLRLINSDGSNERVFHIDAYPGAISPDEKIAAIRVDTQLALLNLASGKMTVLKSLGWRRPEIGNFSADGRYLVYSLLLRQDSEDREVLAIAIDGSSESVLASEPGSNRGAFFTPDGSHVAFVSNRSGRWDLWSLRVAAGKPQGAPQLAKPDVGQVEAKGFTRDGTFYFVQTITQRDAYTVEMDPSTWKITGEPKRASDRFVNATAAPKWSPNGKLLAVLSNRQHTIAYEPGQVIFLIRAADGSPEREFTVPFRFAGIATFCWFPDSQSLLLAEYTAQGRSFRQLDLATGLVRPIFEIPLHDDRVLNVVISPDGHSILYSANDAAVKSSSSVMTRLIRRDLDTGEEKELFHMPTDGQGLYSLVGSRDGKHLAFFANHATWVASTAGGEPRQLWRDKPFPTNMGSAIAWDPQGHGLLYSVSQGPGATKYDEIWYFPIDGGTPHSTGIAMPGLQTPSVHPDGHLLGFTTSTSTSQLWSLKNLFPETRASR